MATADPETLAAEARSARAAGCHAGAVALWRRLLDADPDEWRLALELKHDLQQGLHNPDSDPRFRRAARAMPDDAFLAHYAGRARCRPPS